jgi:hypothetical protein
VRIRAAPDRPYGYAGGMQDEKAPPFESWDDHLKALNDRDLAQLAADYRWLDGEARPQEERQEFHARREAIVAECQRRGLTEAAAKARRPAMGGSGG